MKNLFYVAILCLTISCSKDESDVASQCDNGQLFLDGNVSCLDNGFLKEDNTLTELSLDYLDGLGALTRIRLSMIPFTPDASSSEFVRIYINDTEVTCTEVSNPEDIEFSMDRSGLSGNFSFSLKCISEDNLTAAGSFYNIQQK